MSKDILSSNGLSNRKKQILRSIIETHISSGEPIGSKYLVSSGDIPFSSATIRNEMAELEELGYLEHIHTSSGRVPTNLGYRFYVDSLMENYKLTASEIVTLNNMLTNKIGELDSILQSATKLVASLTNYPTVSIKTDSSNKCVNQFSHMLLDNNAFLLVMRVSDGNVKSKHIRVDFEINNEILSQLVTLLNEYVAGRSPEQITLPLMMQMEKVLGDASKLVNICIKAVYEVTASNDDTNIRFEGVGKFLEYPEFSNVDKMREVLNMIEDKDSIIDIMKEGEEDKVNVVIGKGDEKMVDDSAFIYKKVVVDGRVVGAIGVIGPTRMDYSKVVSTVDYLSDKISNAYKLKLPGLSDDE